jgi:hypothetical protein
LAEIQTSDHRETEKRYHILTLNKLSVPISVILDLIVKIELKVESFNLNILFKKWEHKS